MVTDLVFNLPDAEATDRLARALAPHLAAGDCILLQGPIGAGKSQFCRALIRARLGNPDEDVPSPSFTLVQTYAGDPSIWHADLYRLSHADEVLELGLDQAFAEAITLVEWPDKLGPDAPGDAIRLDLAMAGDGRQAHLRFAGRPALARAAREQAALAFAEGEGWPGARVEALAGDASGRRFFRLRLGGESAVLLDNPAGLADRVEAFVAIARHLTGIGLSAPRILAEDLVAGFVLMEDLGDDLFPRHLARHPEDEAVLYAGAVDVLVALQAAPPLPGLPDMSLGDWAGAAMLAVSHYAAGITGTLPDDAPLRDALARALAAHGDGPRVMIHRDYFGGNLLVLDRPGIRRIGVLDFQLGQMGQRVYDLVSLLQDARRDLPPGLEVAMKARFVEKAGAGAGFEAAYAAWGVQRALRILGIFARLALVEGKADYLPHLPRVMGQLKANLAHPALGELAALCRDLLPEPDAEALEKLRSQCGAFR